MQAIHLLKNVTPSDFGNILLCFYYNNFILSGFKDSHRLIIAGHDLLKHHSCPYSPGSVHTLGAFTCFLPNLQVRDNLM